MKSLQICGTSGSGKTTLVRRLMEDSGATVFSTNARGKPLLYTGHLMNPAMMADVFFLGSYEKTCGGCDTIPSVSIVAGMLRELAEVTKDYARAPIVIFEGLMISHMLGTVGEAQRELGLERHWRAYLDTELRQCLENVIARRAARGQSKPFNPTNTQNDWPRVRNSREKAIAEGFTVRDLRYEHAYDDCLGVLHELAAV
jgi:GTPase SAR1 family protein